MNIIDPRRLEIAFPVAACCLIAGSVHAAAQESNGAADVLEDLEGPNAAFDFEQRLRDPDNDGTWSPVPLDACKNITPLTKEMWSKKHVLTDFKKHRAQDQVGVIVIVKTEYCCHGSRLCAVTTACLEKRSTRLVNRFRVYAAWIGDHPEHYDAAWSRWDDDVIDEYDFVQGPGARLVVMVPTGDGKMYMWQSTARSLDLNRWTFEASKGETPKLESFLQDAVKHAPKTVAAND